MRRRDILASGAAALLTGGASPVQLAALFHGGGSPTLDLQFLTGTLDPRVTFTRASTATYFDATGTLQTAGNNVARFDYDPMTRLPRGLLIEEARTNSATNSGTPASWGTLTGATWTTTTVAPDGGSSGTFLKEDASSGNHAVTVPATIASATSYTVSFFGKAGTRRYVVLTGGGLAGAGLTPSWDLTAGADTSLGSNASFWHGIQALSNGWYRCWASWLTTNTTAFQIMMCAVVNNNNYIGDNASGMYLWGVQQETGAFSTSYIQTTSAAVTRATDFASTPTASWLNPITGTLAVDTTISGINAGAISRIASISDGTTNNLFEFLETGATQLAFQQVVGGVTTQRVLTSSMTTAAYRMAATYSAGLQRSALNGASFADLAGVGVPPMTALTIGNRTDGIRPLTGYVRRVRYWNRALSNSELQRATT